MNRTKILIILLIILAAFFRMWFFFKADNFEGIVTMEKVANALNIIDNPQFSSNFDGNTSVLYNYLLAACLRIWPDILATPRVLAMLFGVLTIIPFYLLVRLTVTEPAAFYSSILLALFPLHAIQSTFSMSDAIFHFFFFSCLYFYFKFKLKEKKIIWLVLAGLLFNIAALLRFESWSFIPVLSILLFRETKKYSLLFLFLSLISPCLWMLLSYHFQRDALVAFTVPARTAQIEILMNRAQHPKSLFGWLNVLRMMLGYVVVLSGLAGIIYSFTKKRFFYLALFFSYLYVLYTFNALAGRMWYNERYAILLGLLILPYSAIFIEKLSVFLRFKPAVLLLPFILLPAVEFNKIAHRYINWHTLPEEIKEISGWLKDNVSASDKILIGADKNDLYGQDIIVRSAIAPRNFFLVMVFRPYPSFTKEDINRYIINEKPAYLILNSKGFLEDILSFDMEQGELKYFGCTFKRVYYKEMSNTGRFNIYKVYYQGDG